MADDEHQKDDHLHNKLHKTETAATRKEVDDDDEPSSFLEMYCATTNKTQARDARKCTGGSLSPIRSRNPTRQLQAPMGLSTVAKNPQNWKALPQII